MIDFKNILLKNIEKKIERKIEKKEDIVDNRIKIIDKINEEFYSKYNTNITDIELEFKDFLKNNAIPFCNKDGSMDSFIRENCYEYSKISDFMFEINEEREVDDEYIYSDEELETDS
jgi:hypothetical protein